jgi:formamidopyrimidine-DNA glycosylase
MQALAERLVEFADGSPMASISILSFSSLASVIPSYDDLIGSRLVSAHARGKYLIVDTEKGSAEGVRLVMHMSQAGRLNFENDAKKTKRARTDRGPWPQRRLCRGASVHP